MDEQTFLSRLSKALKAQVPPDANRGSWIGRRADDLDIKEDRLAAYLHGENQCPGWILLKLFDFFGPEFEAQVRDREVAGNFETLREHLKAMQNEVNRLVLTQAQKKP